MGDEWRNKSYKDMSVSGKIAYNVDNYIEDYKALDKIESKNKELAEIAQEKEKQDKEAVNEIKTYAVGKLTERIILLQKTMEKMDPKKRDPIPVVFRYLVKHL